MAFQVTLKQTQTVMQSINSAYPIDCSKVTSMNSILLTSWPDYRNEPMFATAVKKYLGVLSRTFTTKTKAWKAFNWLSSLDDAGPFGPQDKEKTIFNKLPLELWLCVTDHLQLSSIASSSLTNHQMYFLMQYCAPF